MEEEGERDDGRPHPPPPPPPPPPGPPTATPAGPKRPPAGGPERPRRWRRRNRGRNPVSINVSYIHNNNACDDNHYSRCFFLLHFR